MRNVCVKKVLVVGIIVLFLGVSALSSVSSRSISSPVEMLLEHGVESDDDKPLEDDYKEIISYVDGYGHRDNIDYILPIFIARNIKSTWGDFNICALTRNPFKLFYRARAVHIHIKLFIGFAMGDPDEGISLDGFAIGDITWTPYPEF